MALESFSVTRTLMLEVISACHASLSYEKTTPPTFTDKYEERAYLKHRLALAFRIFAKFGFAEGVAGHITVRDPVDPTSFWVNPFGLHFSLIEDGDLMRVDNEGKVVDGGKNRRLDYVIELIAAYAIHAQIHAARPKVLCAAHSHTTYGRAICGTGKTLQPLTQDSCVFYDDHVLYYNFAGVVLVSEEGKRIVVTLGSKKVDLLGNYGLLIVALSVEICVAWFVLFESCCEVQLLAEANWNTWEALGEASGSYFMGLPLLQVAERDFGERTFLGRGLEPA
ncbi:class II aldolase/adducin domain protein [Massarina eburnea CBS 473.64]|uniref:Class II aldolase/adducin domain protein n=1 Tax=Massarina eburnea CBS 473.64 TaxID=1395130 RepID=A0A6A6S1D2_9PLEO|nr:class II aldolase/adducin domain protein [Massarina eburnea CBS 473.64]